MFEFAAHSQSGSGDADLAVAWQEQLAAESDRLHVREGEFIFRAGQDPKIGLLRSGVVRIFVAPRVGRQLTIRYGRVGDLIGVAPYLARADDWNAEAITDVDVAVLNLDDINRTAAQSPELWWRIAQHQARCTAEALRGLANDAGQPMRVRTARHLREVSVRAPDGRLIAHISRQRLANAVGTVREVVSRELKELRADHVIDTAAGSVTVLDEGRLTSIAAGGSPAA
jgi:CRP/FNR family transcriptional regulator, cyclic AMP receptor protein